MGLGDTGHVHPLALGGPSSPLEPGVGSSLAARRGSTSRALSTSPTCWPCLAPWPGNDVLAHKGQAIDTQTGSCYNGAQQ